MNKKDWQTKEKEFLEMLEKAKINANSSTKQVEELDFFITAIQAEIKTFKQLFG